MKTIKQFFTRKSDMNDNTKIVLAALLVAMFFLFNRIIPGIHTPGISLAATFVPVILAAFIMGPMWAMAVGGIGDILSAVLVPRGPYFFGFTLSWMLAGFIYGLFCYRGRNKSNRVLLVNLIIASLIVLVAERILLSSVWVSIFQRMHIDSLPFLDAPEPFMVIFWARVIAFSILLPFQVAIMWTITRFLRNPIERFLVIEVEEPEETNQNDKD